MSFRVQTEKDLSDLERLGDGIVSESAHLALAVAVHTMGINGEGLTGIVTSSSAQQAKMDLQSFSVGD